MSNIHFIFYLSPLIILIFTAIFVLLLDVFIQKNNRRLIFSIASLGVIGSAATSLQLWNGDALYLFHEAIRLDKFSLFFTFLSLGITLLTALSSYPLLQKNNWPLGEYLFFLLSACVGMSLMAWATDLITLFISLEIMSLAVYILTGIERERLTSSEGALKYFLLGAFSTAFLLYGITFIYAATGSTQFSTIAHFLMSSKYTLPPTIYIGLGLLLVGVGFKISAVPFHMWVPDVYEGAPTPITALMATGVKAAGFSALIRLFLVTLSSLKPQWGVIIIGFSILTMTVGNIAALVQNNIKRMLAYSSIAHAGYILIALAAAQETRVFDLATSSILFYLIAYSFMTIGAFTIVSFTQDLNGFGFKHPYLGIAMTIFMLSLIGVPPTVGFMGKFYIFSSALKGGFFWLAIIGIINSVIASYYYLRVLVTLYMKKETDTASSSLSSSLASSLVFNSVLWITAVGTLLVGLFPSSVFKIITKSITALL